ncbi:MAG: ScyD/ScyE family protein [Ferruginibacter sp.]
MKTKNITGAIIIMAILVASCKRETPFPCECHGDHAPSMKVFATGLNNPRGLKFGPDGNLYVAEGGIGGTNSTAGTCTQVPFPVGPYTGSTTSGRISRINYLGMRTTVTDKLPSSKGNELTGGDIQGVADVAFIGNTLYGLLAGAGCSHGVPSVPNGIVKVNANGTWAMVANMSSWLMGHPVAHSEEDDFEPDGTAYSMINVDGDLFVIEPNHGDFIKAKTNGNISRVADISATQGHIVPTALTFHKGNFYMGNLHPFPIVDGSSNIYKITPGGTISVWATGFTTVTGIAFDRRGRLYVLENTTGNNTPPFPTPGTGKIIRVNLNGSRDIIASGLVLPTGMTFGPDWKLYVSNVGFGPAAIGGGQVIQVDTGMCPCDDDDLKSDQNK